MASVLVVDDDAVLNQMIQAKLKIAGYEVFSALNGNSALEIVRTVDPDLVIMDVMMPGMDGYTTCRRLRAFTETPVLFLTARGEDADLSAGFDAGGDDYLRKPFSQHELELRVRNLVMRVKRSSDNGLHGYSDEDLNIDLDDGTIKRKNRLIHLTPTELRVLRALVRNRGTVMSHTDLLREAWGENYTDAIASLSLYVRYLREKIEEDPSRPRYIHTKWGVGYWFNPPQTLEIG